MAAQRGSLNRYFLAGAAYVTAVGLVTTLLVLKGAGAFENSFPVTTKVPSVGAGLPVGSDVKLRGLRVGQVSDVQVGPGGAVVRMDLDPRLAKAVPASVRSRVLTANVFGVPFVELVPKGPESPALAEHASIQADTSAAALELASLYEKAYDVLVAIEPAKLNSALTAIADAMRGNGQAIGALLEESESYLSKLTPHRKQFERDLVLLQRILSRTEVATPALLDAVENTAHMARFVVANRQGLADLLAVGRHALDTTQGVLEAMEPRLIAVMRVSTPVFETLAANEGSARATLLAFGRLARGFVAARNPNGGVTVRAYFTGMPYPTYSAADCPRYGSLAGPNCGRASATTARYSGAAGTVGTAEELATLDQVMRSVDPAASGLIGVVAGPALRGQTVVTR